MVVYTCQKRSGFGTRFLGRGSQFINDRSKIIQAHKDQPCRGISFAPTDQKFASCSDDGTVRVWDFYTRSEERILRGHGSDVKQVDWHPSKGIIASGSKDLQSPIKLWDPKGKFQKTKNQELDLLKNRSKIFIEVEYKLNISVKIL